MENFINKYYHIEYMAGDKTLEEIIKEIKDSERGKADLIIGRPSAERDKFVNGITKFSEIYAASKSIDADAFKKAIVSTIENFGKSSRLAQIPVGSLLSAVCYADKSSDDYINSIKDLCENEIGIKEIYNDAYFSALSLLYAVAAGKYAEDNDTLGKIKGLLSQTPFGRAIEMVGSRYVRDGEAKNMKVAKVYVDLAATLGKIYTDVAKQNGKDVSKEVENNYRAIKELLSYVDKN